MFTFGALILGLVLWVCFARVFAGLCVCFWLYSVCVGVWCLAFLLCFVVTVLIILVMFVVFYTPELFVILFPARFSRWVFWVCWFEIWFGFVCDFGGLVIWVGDCDFTWIV